MYKFGVHTEISILHRDDEYTYLEFYGVKLRVNKDYLIERLDRKDRWKPISWHDNGSAQMRTSIYNKDGHKSLARGRVVCIVKHGYPQGENKFVKHKDGNTLNDDPDNVEWADSLNKFRCKYRTPEMIEAISKIPVSQRNWQNPEYMKLYNSLKGADGLNHADRFRLKQKALGLVRKTSIVNGKKKYYWAPREEHKTDTTK